MSETTKEKILKINTQGAEKNVKSLKTQIRELKEQLAQLDKGTAEYNNVARQLADTNQKQIEINEAAKYSNKDFGATLSNLTKVSAGVVGAISSINSVMVLMGADSEEAMEAMKTIQSLMAIIQGLSAIDIATKALEGLTNAFKGFNTERGISAGVTAGAATAELAEAGALADNTVKMHKNNEEAVEFNRLNEEGKKATEKSKDAIDEETRALIANKEAKSGNIEAAKQLVDLQIKQKEVVKDATDFANEAVQGQIDGLKKKLDAFEKEYKRGLDLGHTEANDNRMSYLAGQIKRLKTEIKYFETEVLNSADVITAGWGMAVEEGFSMYDDAIEDSIKQMLSAMSPTQLEAASKNLENFVKAKAREIQGLTNLTSEEIEAELDRLVAYADEQDALINQAIANKQIQAMQENLLQKEIIETTNTENAETAAIKGNTTAKEQNAAATGKMVASEQALGTVTKRTEPVLAKMGSSIKNAAKSIVSFVKANPILLVIAAAIGAIVFAVTEYTKAMKKANAEIKLMADLASNINEQYDEQRVRIYTLTSALEDHNSSLEERKKAADELNKLIPNYNAQLDETTGKYTANKEALDEYLEKLYQKIKLEAYEGKIKEYLQQQLELEEKINKMQNSGWKGWNKFWGRISKAKNDIQDLDMQIDKMFKRINDEIDLSKALDENKNGNGGGIKKTFAELFDDLKSLWKEFYKQITQSKEIDRISNTIYTKGQLAFDKLMESINGNLASGKLSNQFKEALKKGLNGLNPEDITPEFVFSEKYLKDLNDRIKKEKETLKNMLAQGKVSEKVLEEQRKRVKETQAELDVVKEITSAAQARVEAAKQTNKEYDERNKSVQQYNEQLSIEQEYYQKTKRNNFREFQYDELFKTIELQKLSIKYAEERRAEYQKELEELKKKPHQLEKELEIQKQIDAENKKINESQTTINETNWKIRLQKLDEEYAKIKRNSELEQLNLETERNLRGGGVADYNTEVDLLEKQLEAMVEYANHIDEYYETKQSKYVKYSDEWMALEQERLAAQEALQDEYRAKELEKDKAQADRKLNIQKTYIAAYQNISSQLSNVLGEAMNFYEEDSKQYLRLKYAQGVTDTLSGTLSAYMSGIESGIPAPGNQILAAAMAASTFAVGVMQLANMKSGTLANTTATPVQIGTEYDTLSYAQNADILSSIQDSRVWVLESDITNTQRRVEVQETQATF